MSQSLKSGMTANDYHNFVKVLKRGLGILFSILLSMFNQTTSSWKLFQMKCILGDSYSAPHVKCNPAGKTV